MYKKIIFPLLACLLLTLPIFALSENEELNEVKKRIENGKYSISMMEANTHNETVSLLKTRLEEYLSPQTVIYDVVLTEFSPASSLEEDVYGSFRFIAYLRCGKYRATTKEISGKIDTSRVELSVSSGKNDVTLGQNVVLYAKTVGIKNGEFAWYRASSENGVGTLIEGQGEQTYTVPSDEVYSAYYYCVCKNIRSNSVRISVSAPYVAVGDIILEVTEMRVGQSFAPTYTVLPDNATDKTVQWTLYAKNGEAVLTNGVLYAKKTGKAELTAKIESSLDASHTFTKTFQITILEKEKEPEIKSHGVDASVLKNVDGMTVMGIAPEMCVVRPLLEDEAKKLVRSYGIDLKSYDVLTSFYVEGEQNADSFRIRLDDGKSAVLALYKDGEGKLQSKQLEQNELCVLPSCSTVVLLGVSTYDAQALLLLLPVLVFPPLVAYFMAKLNGKRKRGRKTK